MKRRTIILAGGTVVLSTIAGCTGSDDGGTQTTTATEDPATTQQTQTTSAGVETTSGAETETATDEETMTTPEEDTETPTAEDTETTTEEGEDVLFGTIYAMPDNYRVEAEYSNPETGDSGTMTGRYHGSNYYNRIESDSTEDVFEIYHVDGDDYVVMNGTQCFVNPGPRVKPDSGAEGDSEAYGEKPDADLRPSGTTEIEGETVYIFEVTGEDIEGKMTLYVSVSTGYLRRVETDTATLDFYDWGNVDPISKPDMECEG